MSVRLNLLLAAITMTGCAGGSELNPGAGTDAGAGTSGAESTAGNAESGVRTTGISATAGPPTSSSTSDGPTSGDGSTTGTDDESTTGASSGTASTTEVGTETGTNADTDTDAETDTEAETETDDCDLTTPDTTCELGVILDAVSGDDGSQVSQTGSGSTWLLVQVQETNANIFEEDLSYTVALESSEVDYDLYVYEGPQDGAVDCDVVPVQGVGKDGLETVSASWDDDQGLGGEDDSLWLAIEIVHLTGSDCGAEWTLTVTGGS